MQSESVLGKAERQRLIASVVTRKRIGTQFELLAALADAGCRVTQATVSRDLRELGLEKAHDPLGRPRYVLPETRRADPRDALRRVLGDKNADIFDGLAVDPGLLKKAKYVPAERVGQIVEGSVALELTKAEFDGLDDYEV